MHESRNILKTILDGFLELVFPPVCLLCKEHLYHEKIPVCKKCLNNFKYMTDDILQKKKVAPHLDSLHITFIFNSTYKQLIHHLKYKKYPLLGTKIGELVAANMNIETNINFSKSQVTPIPLHPVKYRERGYNQARSIAQGFARSMGLYMNSKILKRIKNTRSQTKLTKQERQKNMSGAFAISKYDKNLQNVLLIDDVYTTGATMDAAARVLKSGGVQQVHGIASAAPLS